MVLSPPLRHRYLSSFRSSFRMTDEKTPPTEPEETDERKPDLLIPSPPPTDESLEENAKRFGVPC